MVGRVCPRHGHRGRPPNSAVRQHQMRRAIEIGAVILGAVLLYGVIDGAIELIFHGELPHGEWWQFAIAIPIIGAVAVGFEVIGEGVGELFGLDKRGTARWKKYLGVLTIIAAATGLLVALKWLGT